MGHKIANNNAQPKRVTARRGRGGLKGAVT